MSLRYRLVLATLITTGLAGAAFASPHRRSTNTIHVTVTATSDPYLAGMPDGATASSDDTAPAQSPTPVPGVCLTAGDSLTFGATGAASNAPGFTLFPPDGDGSSPIAHVAGAENGISDVVMPLNALLGVFLGPDNPSLTAAPGAIDFSAASPGLNFTVLSPELKQVFFIGDGLTSAAVRQKFVVPAGATRLFLGTMDGYEWMNNQGSFEVDVNSTCDVTPTRATTWSALKGLYR